MDWTVIIVDLGQAVLPWIATFVLGLLGKYLYSKIENETWRGIATRATEEIFDAVREVHQVYVMAIKEGRKDGALTAAEKKSAKSAALRSAKDNLGVKGFARLAKVVGGHDNAESYLSGKVETAVHLIKIREQTIAALKKAPKR